MDIYLQKCLEMESNNGVCVSNRGGYQSQSFLEDDFKNKFYEIYNFVIDSVNAVGKDTESKYKLRNSWVNINKKSDCNVSHVHAQNSISGCVYLKTNPDSGRIVFENPTPSIHYNINDNVDGFFGVYWCVPIVGELIIFPSYLRHCVEPNNSEDIRVSIAFNCNRI
jgi:uncharacterized protein (TIGR02466 family)